MSIDVANLKELTKTKGPEALAAEDVARHGLAGKFINVPGVGWLQWDGKRWLDHPTVKATALEAVRIFAISVEQAHRDAEAKSQKKLRMTLEQVFIGLGFGKADATAIAADPAHTKTHLEVYGPNKTKATKDQKTLIKSLQSECKASRDQADIWRNLMSKAGIGNLLALASGMPGIVVIAQRSSSSRRRARRRASSLRLSSASSASKRASSSGVRGRLGTSLAITSPSKVGRRAMGAELWSKQPVLALAHPSATVAQRWRTCLLKMPLQAVGSGPPSP